jgi:hypothetical protein
MAKAHCVIAFFQNITTVKCDMKNLQQNLIHNFKRSFLRRQAKFLVPLSCNPKISNVFLRYKWHIPFTIAVGQEQDNSEVKTVGFEGLIWMNRTSGDMIGYLIIN